MLSRAGFTLVEAFVYVVLLCLCIVLMMRCIGMVAGLHQCAQTLIGSDAYHYGAYTHIVHDVVRARSVEMKGDSEFCLKGVQYSVNWLPHPYLVRYQSRARGLYRITERYDGTRWVRQSRYCAPPGAAITLVSASNGWIEVAYAVGKRLLLKNNMCQWGVL